MGDADRDGVTTLTAGAPRVNASRARSPDADGPSAAGAVEGPSSDVPGPGQAPRRLRRTYCMIPPLR